MRYIQLGIMLNLVIALTLLSLSSCSVVEAADMQFKGKLIEPPSCQVNAGQDINIYFDKVGINKVDGNNYRKEINIPMDCISTNPWSLNLAITTNSVATFAAGTVQSNIDGLGMQILIDGSPIEFNRNFLINPEAPPKLEVVPLSENGIPLTEGKFTASATLTIQYQ